ncbi:MAG: hypothetical protein ACHQ2Z_10220, partial [Elusimicrobiota bacterium]
MRVSPYRLAFMLLVAHPAGAQTRIGPLEPLMPRLFPAPAAAISLPPLPAALSASMAPLFSPAPAFAPALAAPVFAAPAAEAPAQGASGELSAASRAAAPRDEGSRPERSLNFFWDGLWIPPQGLPPPFVETGLAPEAAGISSS